MKIFFRDITFNGSPLVWEYDENTNKAQCLFITAEKGATYNSKSIIKELGEKKYLGISLLKESAIIEDYLFFSKKYKAEKYVPRAYVPALNLKIVHEKNKERTPPPLSTLSATSNSSRANTEQQCENETSHEFSNPLVALSTTRSLSSRNNKKTKDEGESVVEMTSSTGALSIRAHSTRNLRDISNGKSDTMSRDIDSEQKISTKLKCTTTDRARKGTLTSSAKLSKTEKTQKRFNMKPAKKEEITYSPRFKFKEKKTSFDSILLEDMIHKQGNTNTTIWGDTLSYKGYFTNKTSTDRLKRTAQFLKTNNSFGKELQYVKNDNLYPIKCRTVNLVQQMFKQELNPAYQEWKKMEEKRLTSEILNELFNYFRYTVWHTMLNERFNNNQPTELEVLSKEAIQARFNGNNKLFEFANYEIRQARCRHMTLNLSVLIDKTCSLELGSTQTMSKEALEMLISFRNFISQDPARVIRLRISYAELIDVLIESGKMEWTNQQLTNELLEKLTDKGQEIDSFSSLSSTVKFLLLKANEERKKPIEKTACEKFAFATINKVINKLCYDNEFRKTPCVSQISLHDEDLYLSSGWTDACKEKLKTINWSNILKHIDDHKKFENDVVNISGKLHAAITMKGLELSVRQSFVADKSQNAITDDSIARFRQV